MTMGPGPTQAQVGKAHESVKCVGGLWAFGEGTATMPDGASMTDYLVLGYDVSYKEYRGCWFRLGVVAPVETMWVKLSADGKVMTLNGVGPSFTKDGETANYRHVIEIIDEDHRTLTSYGQDENGEWQEFMKVRHTPVSNSVCTPKTRPFPVICP